MSVKKTQHSVAKVMRKRTRKDGSTYTVTVGYLSRRDEESGLDIALDMQGYIIESL